MNVVEVVDRSVSDAMHVMQAAARHESPGVAAIPATEPGHIRVEPGIDVDPLEGRQHLGALQAGHAGRVGDGG